MSGCNVFYTGSAGCGKSTVLNRVVKCLRFLGKKVSIVAPTGRAALYVNGSTFWTYAGWTPDTRKRDMKKLLAECRKKRIWKRLNATDVLIIDEISMMESFAFERLNRIMKKAREQDPMDDEKVFGGVQIIVAGDFLQLPPVKPLQFCLECGQELTPVDKRRRCPKHGDYHTRDQWAFMSDAWRECDFVHVNLTTIHRQKNLRFIQLLEKLRLGKLLNYEDLELLSNHDCNVEGAVRLFSRREDVRRLNEQEFARLTSPTVTYTCDDDIWLNPEHVELIPRKERDPVDGSLIALNEHRLEKKLEMKVGMRVMLLYNLDIQEGLVNGSQGTVTGFKPLPTTLKEILETNGEHANYRSSLIERYIDKNAGKEQPVIRFDDNGERTIYPVCMVNELGDESPWSLISRTQIPLIAAWAMTIHKAQGMTIPRVVVDLGGTFETGQDYVALSRATGLEGLKVENLGSLNRDIDPQVKAFLKDNFGVE